MEPAAIISLILFIISEALALIPTTYPISGILQGILSLLIPAFAPARNGAAIGANIPLNNLNANVNPTMTTQSLMNKLQELETLIAKNNIINGVPNTVSHELQEVVVK